MSISLQGPPHRRCLGYLYLHQWVLRHMVVHLDPLPLADPLSNLIFAFLQLLVKLSVQHHPLPDQRLLLLLMFAHAITYRLLPNMVQ